MYAAFVIVQGFIAIAAMCSGEFFAYATLPFQDTDVVAPSGLFSKLLIEETTFGDSIWSLLLRSMIAIVSCLWGTWSDMHSLAATGDKGHPNIHNAM